MIFAGKLWRGSIEQHTLRSPVKIVCVVARTRVRRGVERGSKGLFLICNDCPRKYWVAIVIVSSAFWLACEEPVLSSISSMPLEMRGLESQDCKLYY